MFDFIVENYYAILVICILLIFATIGYLIDLIKSRKYQDNNGSDAYIPEEEVFIKKIEKPIEDSIEKEDSIDELLKRYNQEQKETNSNN